MKSLEENLKEVDHLADGVGYGIEPFIKRPVAILMSVGFPTVASCEGHLDRGTPYPWIDIDHLPQFPREIYDEETSKIWYDKAAFKQLVKDNHASRKRIEKLLKRAGYSKNFQIERRGIHHAIILCAVGSSLEGSRQWMTEFTEWILNNLP